MSFNLTTAVSYAATAVNGLLAGATLDQSIKQLPARHKIGLPAYSAYSRAADLGNGIAFYAVLGIGSALLSIASAIVAHKEHAAAEIKRPLYVAVGFAILHSLATTQAAPTNFSQRQVAPDDEAALARIFNRFERWQTVRSVFVVLNFGALLWALGEQAFRNSGIRHRAH